MKYCLLGIFVVQLLGCSPSTPVNSASDGAASTEVAVADALVQFSLLAALAADDYEGVASLQEVLASGDFGVGTFDALDGEMIVLDGQVYQALADGSIRVADPKVTTPFAVVTYFDEDGRIENLSAATLDDLDRQLDRKLPRRNSPYALRITGDFTDLTLRSVPAQSPPFQPLVEVVKRQITWQRRNVRGTLVGVRCPAWMGTLNVSGYHWHFLSDDRKIGGHVLACEFQNGLLRFDECSAIVIHIPQSAEFDEFDERSITEQDIDQVERQRTRSGTP